MGIVIQVIMGLAAGADYVVPGEGELVIERLLAGDQEEAAELLDEGFQYLGVLCAG
jgi:hypothetical protein